MDKDRIYEDLEIRDQADHESAQSDMGEFTAETVAVINTLDQQVDFQLIGGVEGIWFDMKTFSVAANTNGYQTVSDYFPTYKMTVSCPANPTTGNLNVYMVKSK